MNRSTFSLLKNYFQSLQFQLGIGRLKDCHWASQRGFLIDSTRLIGVDVGVILLRFFEPVIENSSASLGAQKHEKPWPTQFEARHKQISDTKTLSRTQWMSQPMNVWMNLSSPAADDHAPAPPLPPETTPLRYCYAINVSLSLTPVDLRTLSALKSTEAGVCPIPGPHPSAPPAPPLLPPPASHSIKCGNSVEEKGEDVAPPANSQSHFPQCFASGFRVLFRCT